MNEWSQPEWDNNDYFRDFVWLGIDRSTMMNFGQAIEALKRGKKVERAGWNGKGMFLYLVPADEYPARTAIAKKHWGEDALVPYQAYIAMKTVQDTVVPWLASQTDILAEDWAVVE